MKETTSRSHLIQNVRPTSVFYLRVSLNFFFFCICILETIFVCIHFTWIYLSCHLQSFRGTSRHAPVAFFSFLLHFAVDSVF